MHNLWCKQEEENRFDNIDELRNHLFELLVSDNIFFSGMKDKKTLGK